MASNEDLDLLYQGMRAVTYRRIEMAMKTASFVGVFVDCCLFGCCPGGRWGDTEQIVARCRRLLAYGVALDMPNWMMLYLLLRRTAVAIGMACNGGTFVCHHQFHTIAKDHVMVH